MSEKKKRAPKGWRWVSALVPEQRTSSAEYVEMLTQGHSVIVPPGQRSHVVEQLKAGGIHTRSQTIKEGEHRGSVLFEPCGEREFKK